MATVVVHELDHGLRLRLRHGTLPTLLVLADGRTHECVSLKEGFAFEYTGADWLSRVRQRVEFSYEVTDEELMRDNAEAPTEFVRGRELQNLEHSRLFFHGAEHFRLVSWDHDTLRFMFSFDAPDAPGYPFVTHVSVEARLMPVAFS